MSFVIIVMGVSGVGKTTIGQALASQIDATFAEGDSYHPEVNVEKMRSGIPLTDDDRWPWLDHLRDEIDGWLRDGKRVVLTCSALKSSYRTRLQPKDGDVHFVHLNANQRDIEERLSARKGHYMPASLLESQFDTLEPPKDAIIIDAAGTIEVILDELEQKLALTLGTASSDH